MAQSTQQTPTQVSNAVAKSIGGAVTATNIPGGNPHDAPGYNPVAQPGKNLNGTSTGAVSSDATGGTALATNTSGQPSPQTVNATPATGAVQNTQTGNAFSGTNLSSQGLGSVADQLKQTYTKAHAGLTNSDVPPPPNQGAADAGIKKIIDSQPKETPPPPVPPSVQTFFDPNSNPAIQKSTQDLMEFLSPATDRKMLDEHIQSLNTEKTEMVGLKTDLMNMKRVMAGTEDDIRDEITKGNGFATESQIQALTIARNKTLQRQATFIQDQIDSLRDTISNDTSLVGEEKQMAMQQATQRLGILNYQQTNYNNQMTAARDSLKSIVTATGYDGLYKAVQGNPTQLARDEQILGLAPGGLAQLASSPTANIDLQIKKATLAHTLAETDKINSDLSASTPGTPSYNKNQDKLEQQYRQVLTKEASSRSGDLGIQNQKVSQAIHLTSLLNQYKDTKGNFNVPQAQYAELVFGLANLLSPSGTTSEGDRAKLQSLTLAGNIKGAIQYLTGTPQNGNTQAIIKNLADSIDRQGGVAEDLRNQSVQFLQGLAPTGLEQSRIDALNKNTLSSYQTFKQTGKVGGTMPEVPTTSNGVDLTKFHQ